MEKVLLVFEQYTEMIVFETALQKTGYKTLGITNDYSVGEKLLSFNPDYIVVYGTSGRVKTINVGRKLHELTKWKGKSILIFHPDQRPDASDFRVIKSDMILEFPLTPSQIVMTLAEMSQLSDSELHEKLSKLSSDEEEETHQFQNQDQNKVEHGTNDINLNFQVDKAKDSSFTLLHSESVQKSAPLSELDKLLTPLQTKTTRIQSVDPQLEGLLKPQQDLQQQDELNAKTNNDEEFSANQNTQDLLKISQNLKSELSNSLQKKEERQSRYDSFLKKNQEVDFALSQLKRTEARRAFKEMSKDWKKEDVKSQDEYRKEFVRAMFKK